MVQVRKLQTASLHNIDIDAWLQRIAAELAVTNSEPLARACELIDRVAPSPPSNADESYSRHCLHAGLEMAQILADLKLDIDTLVAALLYRAVRENKIPLTRVRQEFGDTVAKLVDGVLKMAAISVVQHQSEKSVLGDNQRQTEMCEKCW